MREWLSTLRWTQRNPIATHDGESCSRVAYTMTVDARPEEQPEPRAVGGGGLRIVDRAP